MGTPIEAGEVNGRAVAVVSTLRAPGGPDHIFVVVDLSDSANPRAIGMLSLPGNPYAFKLQGALGLRASGMPDAHLYLAQHTADGWRLLTGPLARDVDGILAASFTPAGTVAPGASLVIAVVTPDEGITAPALEDPLPAAALAAIPITATSTGTVDPPTLSPGGGTARGTLTIASPEPLPSGTVVQTAITETFNLTSGEVASEEQRAQDLVLYRANGDLTASFPIVPSRTFAVTELASGTVHLDILAGRETMRGVAGGNEPVSLTSGEAILKVARGALTEDTAVAFQSVLLSSFLPSAPDLMPIAEFSIDFSGRTLATSAELSVPASAVAPYDAALDTLLVARVERVSGIPRLLVVSLAAMSNDRVVTQPYAAAMHPRQRLSRHLPCRSSGLRISMVATSLPPEVGQCRRLRSCPAPR